MSRLPVFYLILTRNAILVREIPDQKLSNRGGVARFRR
jgi:hypothetical protein